MASRHDVPSFAFAQMVLNFVLPSSLAEEAYVGLLDEIEIHFAFEHQTLYPSFHACKIAFRYIIEYIISYIFEWMKGRGVGKPVRAFKMAPAQSKFRRFLSYFVRAIGHCISGGFYTWELNAHRDLRVPPLPCLIFLLSVLVFLVVSRNADRRGEFLPIALPYVIILGAAWGFLFGFAIVILPELFLEYFHSIIDLNYYGNLSLRLSYMFLLYSWVTCILLGIYINVKRKMGFYL